MRKTDIALTFLGLTAMSNALALPTIYPTTTTYLSEIVNETNSNLVADDTDKRVIYVMPPNSAKASVLGLHTITANVGFCKEMADTQSYSRRITQKISELESEEVILKKEIDVLWEKISKARKELADHVTLTNLDEIASVDDRIIEIETRFKSLNEILLNCSQHCQNLKDEIRNLREEKRELTQFRREFTQTKLKEVKLYERKKAVVDGLVKDREDKEEASTRVNNRLLGIRENFHSMYAAFGKMEGARASIKFESNWEDNVDILRRDNPSFDFKKMLTQNAVITSNIVDLTSIPTGGAILGYDIGGNKEEGKLLYPAYPDTLSGNIRLSLIGTCPILRPEYFDINMPNTTDEMAYGLTISYEYPTAFVAEVKATYNMHKMYQKIVKSKSSGGLFRSKKLTSVEERSLFKDEFKVEWLEQDSGNAIADDKKAEMEREMRHNVFARIATLALPAMANASALVTLPEVPPSGAIVLANSLQKNCPGNYYCVGAAMALNFLDSIFGSQTATSSYTNIQDAETVERWSRKQVIYKPWISTYSK